MADPYSFYVRPLAVSDIGNYLEHHQRCHATSLLYLSEADSIPNKQEAIAAVEDPMKNSFILIAVPSNDTTAQSLSDSRVATLHYVEHSMSQQEDSQRHPPKLPAVLGHAVVLPYDTILQRAAMVHSAKLAVVLPAVEELGEKLYDAVEQALYKELLKRSKAQGLPYTTFIARSTFIEDVPKLARFYDNCCDSGFTLVGREKGVIQSKGHLLDSVVLQHTFISGR